MDKMYEKKYFKYKSKFLNLKNKNLIEMNGGHSSVYIKILGNDKDLNYLKNNNNLKNYIVLDTKINENIESISNKYKKKMLDNLDNLLVPKNGKINVDFINDFNRNIHIDIEGKYNINNGKFNENLNYSIDKLLSAATGGGDIYLLNKNNNNLYNLPKNLILKVFKDNININAIQDYLSLEITRIVNSTNYNSLLGFIPGLNQNNYIEITQKYYDEIFLFNDDYISRENDFLKTVNNNDKKLDSNLYISSKNNNFINEIIINLIIEKIILQKDYKKYNNYIKYHNYFITNVNGQYRGCVIMDVMDGTLANLINIIKSKNVNDDNLDKLYDSIVEQIVPSLLALKTKKYQFTHTDMKIENIFYKEIQNKSIDDKYFVDSDNKYYKFYIADFDKSSITFNNIRFYNNYADSHSKLTNFIFDPQTFYGIYMNFNVDKNKSTYKLTRNLENVATEVFAMRYIMFPFFLFFDLQSLCFSLFYGLNKYEIKTNSKFDQFVHILFKDSLKDIKTIYAQVNNEYNGDFSKLLTPLVINEQVTNIHKVNIQELFNKYSISEFDNKKIINTILLSKSNKLIISIPFIPKDIITKSGIQSSSLVYVPDKISTSNFYKFKYDDKYNKLIEFIYNKTDNIDNYLVYYTGNMPTTSAWRINFRAWGRYGVPIIITNRYSSKTLLFEYDFIYDNLDIEFIFNTYKDILLQSLPKII